MDNAAGTETTMEDEGGVAIDMKAEAQGFSGKAEDFQRDLALLQKPAPVTEVPTPTMVVSKPAEVEMGQTEPEQPQKGQPPATVTPEVPAKFLDKDGQPDLEKVEKSTRSAEEAIAKYLEKEKLLRQKAAEVDRLSKSQGYAAMAPEVAPATPAVPDSFEAQLENDFKANPGKTLARLFQAAKDASVNDITGRVDSVAQEIELSKRERELHGLAKNDPWVVSEQGISKLTEYRERNPRLANWTEAYKAYLGDQEYLKRVNRQVPTPTPKAVTAPPTPVTAGGRPSQAQPAMNIGSADDIAARLSKLTPAQEDAFWKSQGLPPVHKRR